MRKILFSVLLLVAIVFTSCKKEVKISDTGKNSHVCTEKCSDSCEQKMEQKCDEDCKKTCCVAEDKIGGGCMPNPNELKRG